MSGFSNAGRMLFTAACGKIRLPSTHVPGFRHDSVSSNGPVDLSPLAISFRCLSISPVNERLKAFRVEEKMGIAPPPLKPMGPYLRWAKENRGKLMDQSPKKDFAGMGQYLGKIWTTMPEDQKKPYMKAYEQEMADYKEKRDKYLAGLSDEQKQALAKARKEAFSVRRANKDRISTKKKMRELKKPKKPMSAFVLYASERRKELAQTATKGQTNFKTQLGQMAAEWRSMSVEAKAPYEKQYKALFAQYSAEMEAWEEQMISSGNLEYVRTSTRSRLDENGQLRRTKKKRREPNVEASKAEPVKNKLPRSLELETPAQEPPHAEKRGSKKTKPTE